MSRFVKLEFEGEGENRGRSRLQPRDEEFYLEEARQALAAGRFERALRTFSRVLEFNPRCLAAWAGQVRMLIELEEFEEANRWADKALEVLPGEPELLAVKAVVMGRLGDLDAALSYSDAAVAERGGVPEAWLCRGDVLLACRERRAGFCFEKAMELSPSDWLIPWLASRIHFFYEKFSLALKFSQQALALDGAQSVVWLQLGRCQWALGLATQARLSLEQSRQLNPDCEATRAALAEIASPGLWRHLRNFWRRLFSS
ncbi:MAG TPA: tetratricopeptide repeat protein [Methylomirabilota bacterium]|nr:tetratricopeptide repeat protein [Methylomirabilota bacterium]